MPLPHASSQRWSSIVVQDTGSTPRELGFRRHESERRPLVDAGPDSLECLIRLGLATLEQVMHSESVGRRRALHSDLTAIRVQEVVDRALTLEEQQQIQGWT